MSTEQGKTARCEPKYFTSRPLRHVLDYKCPSSSKVGFSRSTRKPTAAQFASVLSHQKAAHGAEWPIGLSLEHIPCENDISRRLSRSLTRPNGLTPRQQHCAKKNHQAAQCYLRQTRFSNATNTSVRRGATNFYFSTGSRF